MNNDIVTLLLEIKENIKKVENDIEVGDSLKRIESLFFDFAELVKLFLISERDSYYGYFLLNMKFVVNFRSKSIAGIRLNSLPPVFETNPLLLCKFTLKEILYIFCHEIDHIMLNHPAEMVKANPTNDEKVFDNFNIAADASVNDRIDDEIINEKRKFLSRPDGSITSKRFSEMYGIPDIKECESYKYYFDLIKDNDGGAKKNGQQSILDSLDESEQSNSGDSNSSSNDKGKDSASDSNSSNETSRNENSDIVTSKNCGEILDHNWEVGDDYSSAEEITKEFINKVNESMDEETRGMMPGFYSEVIEKINKPAVISWQAVLKKYIGTISANKTKTRTRLNRRQPERFDLSGTKEDKILKVAVAIDTSGSMSNEMISIVLNEIFDILAKRKHEVTIIECDAEINRVYRAKNKGDVETKVLGRGGTCFTPVIEYVNNDKYFRDALLIYFTDGYGEYDIPKPLTYRNIWVVFDGKENLSLREPYGIVLDL